MGAVEHTALWGESQLGSLPFVFLRHSTDFTLLSPLHFYDTFLTFWNILVHTLVLAIPLVKFPRNR